MATAEEGGVTAITTPSSYGGGGVGGKFRRKTFRRQATPYDRPPAALRGISHNSGGWLAKVFVDPARKLLSHGVDRLFASVFRKRLPAPVPQRQPEVNSSSDDATQPQLCNGEETREQLVEGECSHLTGGSTGKKISDVEQFLKQNTFTRPEIVRLTELLQYKAAEVSSNDSCKERDDSAVAFGQHGQFSSPAVENRKDIWFSSSISTPVHQSKVPGDDIGSPADIAKAYMGTRASKASSSVHGFLHHRATENMERPVNGSFPAITSVKNNSFGTSMAENGSTVLNFGSRAAIYNIARTPYSRGNSIFKVGAKLHSQLPSSSPTSSLAENSGSYGPRTMSLKRRISVLDDELGSIGPIRRIRQKSHLLASRVSHGISGDVRSHTGHTPELMGERSNKDSRNAVENGNCNDPVTSHAHVPSQSSEVATKILQQLEKLSPKEKFSQSKSHYGLEKSRMQLTDNMLSRRALRSMERLDSPILSLEMHVNKMPEEVPSKLLPDSDDSSKKPETNEGIGPKGHYSETKGYEENGNLSLNSANSLYGTKTSDSSAGNGIVEPSQKKRAFRISAQEDFLELDDETPGPSSISLTEKPEREESFATVNKVIQSKEANHMKTESQTDLALSKGVDASKAHESITPSVSGIGESGLVSFLDVETPTDTSQSEATPVSIERSKEANGPSQAFSFSSKVDEAFPPLPSHSTKESEPTLECPSSLITTLPLPGSLEKNPEVEHLSHARVGDANGIFGTKTAPNPSPFFLPPSVGAAFSSDAAEKSVGAGVLNSSITSGANVISSGAPTSFGDIISVPTANSSRLSENLLAVSEQPITSVSVTADYSPKAETHESFDGRSEPPPATGPEPASGLFSNFSQSSQTNLKGSIFGDPYKNPLSGDGTFANKGSMFASSASTHDTSAHVPGSSQASATPQEDGNIATKNGTEASFGLSSSSTTSIGLQTGGTTPVFTFGSSSSITALGVDKITQSSSFSSGSSDFASLNASGSFSGGSPSIFGVYGWSSASSSAAINSVTSSSTSSNIFASSWKNQSPVFAFGASSTPSGPVNFSTSVFSSSTTASSSSHFSFNPTSTSIPSSSSLPFSQPVFGKSIPTGLNSSSGNTDQMNAEDSMAEDPMQSSAPAFPVFGQSSAPLSASPSLFGSNAPSQPNPFFSFGQQSQATPQASGSLEFNASGSAFSMGSGGPDKSRRTVRVSKIRNRKKP